MAQSSGSAAAAGKSGPKSILVLGGTGFIGPYMVREALRRGHTVTLFNRGRTNDDLFPDLETIRAIAAAILPASRAEHGMLSLTTRAMSPDT
ncbi:MAG: NAD-dependent epimerase/dehydratase family protein [Gammaproteobacteria bacterium]|nr:NAD-dependent epimerase/dehydratase family protein [Gammaproteobacteria bacterium]MDH5305174.1 NAD-dependent epimerase/dehydratase family protein [Gammaproteobacteria bacterium]MDH5323419.1 NAD-dependent epimerase/dehydratase family protein [Gammaproteobacteria bacterium]